MTFRDVENYRLVDGEKLDVLPSADLTGQAGKVMSVNVGETALEFGDAGSGDMTKVTYDTDNSGVVDDSELLEGNDSAYHLSRTNHTGTQTASTISDFDTEVSNNTDVAASKTITDFISVTQNVDLDQMETDIAALANGMVYKGVWDASVGTFPGGGVAQTGWFYYVSVGGTVDGIEFSEGDNLVATTDNASTTTYAGNWSKHDQTDAVQSVAGKTGVVTLVKGDVGLGNVDNTSDATKNSATATLTNKTIDLTDNILSGTKSEFNTVLSDDNFAFVGTANTFTDTQIINGDVGIGITPDSKLDVDAGNGRLRVRNYTDGLNINVRGDNGEGSFVSFAEDGVADRWHIGTDAGSSNLSFRTSFPGAGTERLTITNGGNVGIGTTTPGSTLDVSGNANINNSATTDTLFVTASGAGTGRGMVLYDGASGTSTGAMLQVDVANGSATRTVLNLLNAGSGDTFNAAGDLIVKSDGNVGIGTSPSYKLHIFADSNIRVINANADNNTNQRGFNISSSNSGFVSELVYGEVSDASAGGFAGFFRHRGSGTALRADGYGSGEIFEAYNLSGQVFSIENNGNVGVGDTSPGQAISVSRATAGQGRVSVNETATGGVNNPGYMIFNEGTFKGGMFYDEAGDYISLFGASIAGVIDSSNYLGWGTTTPSALVHIQGDGASSDRLLFLDGDSKVRFQTQGAFNASMELEGNNGNIYKLEGINSSNEFHIKYNGTTLFHIESGGGINMASLPTSSAGLSAGDLWNNSGVVNIV